MGKPRTLADFIDLIEENGYEQAFGELFDNKLAIAALTDPKPTKHFLGIFPYAYKLPPLKGRACALGQAFLNGWGREGVDKAPILQIQIDQKVPDFRRWVINKNDILKWPLAKIAAEARVHWQADLDKVIWE